jgi:hypothetical protein
MNGKLRWYDKNNRLSSLLESLKDMPAGKRDKLISGMMALVKSESSDLLDQFVMDFPLDINRRRWYDKDPYLWLIMNGLKYASDELLVSVTKYLSVNKVS